MYHIDLNVTVQFSFVKYKILNVFIRLQFYSNKSLENLMLFANQGCEE